jgi:AraC-like DNA-binding protein
MKIYNIEEHLACQCYDNRERPLVEVRHFKRGETGVTFFSSNEFIFMLEGKMAAKLRDNPGGELRKGQFAFFPASDELRYKAFAKSTVLVLRLTASIRLCHTFSIEQLFKYMDTTEKPKDIFAMEINPRLQHFADGLVNTWEDGLRCRYFLQAEISKLLTMIRAYYPKEDLCRFFYPVLSPDTAFSEFVRMHHLKYRTVNELAAAYNMTAQQFSRRFTGIFGEAPYEWMQREKARLIYGEICMSDRSFKDIADEYGFDIQTHFNRFCKKELGRTPGEIRKKRS